MLQDNGSDRIIINTVGASRDPRSLAEVGRKLKTAMGDAACGPLIAAAEVVELAKHWQSFEAEAGGASCSAWLQETLGRGKHLDYFTKRHRAVTKLGEASRRRIHHQVAVYVERNVPQQYMRKVKEMLFREYRNNGSNPLTQEQARPRILEIVGTAAPVRKRTCKKCAEREAECERLRLLLKSHGIDE